MTRLMGERLYIWMCALHGAAFDLGHMDKFVWIDGGCKRRRPAPLLKWICLEGETCMIRILRSTTPRSSFAMLCNAMLCSNQEAEY